MKTVHAPLQNDPLRKQLDEALSRIELYTPEEQKKAAKEIAHLKKKLGHDGFQRYLIKKAGLE